MPLPPKPRPVRPRRALPAPAARKNFLPMILGAAALAAVVVVLVIVLGKEEEAPRAAKPSLPEAAFYVHLYHRDLGTERLVAVYVAGVGSSRPKPGDFAFIDGAGKEHRPEAADPRDYFVREAQREPRGIALSLRAPADLDALDLRLPDGKKTPVYRRPGKDAYQPLLTTVKFEDWSLTASGKLHPDRSFELEIRARPIEETPFPLNADKFVLLTDDGRALTPEVRTRDPIRLRFPPLPPGSREVRLQVGFRGVTPQYLMEPVAPAGETASKEPVTGGTEKEKAAPKEPGPSRPEGDLRKEFEAKLADPVAALKFLVDKPSAETVNLARGTIARTITEDIAAGLKAFKENKADVAERHLVRAAFLADPYHAEFSRESMRLLFLMKQPRRTRTDCASCKGAGAGACGSCKAGLAEGTCPRCEAKGEVACLLCDGSGTLDHHGFRGSIEIVLEKPLKFKYQGRDATIQPQTITWMMSPCAGAGAFPLQFQSSTGNTGSVQQPCSKFWDEMKNYVFNGKSKVRVPNKQGRIADYPHAAARRFFADYELCKGGKIPCDLCAGRKTEPCALCSGKGQALLLCGSCRGTSLRACETCKGYGDPSWLAKVLPPDSAISLRESLAEQASALNLWMDERARRASRSDDLKRRLEESKKGLDASAKVAEDLVEIACTRCKGSGANCADCWATGRREYFAGTAQYERYGLVKRLERQLKEASSAPPDPPALAALSAQETVARGPVIDRTKLPPTERLVKIPGSVEEMIRQADQLHESGKVHLEKSKASNDPAIWMPEANQALADFKAAQTLYTTAQEKLDESGAPVPKELLHKFRTNMQALIMARRAAP